MSRKDFNGTNIVNGVDMGKHTPCDYLRVSIDLESAYEWGRGWTAYEQKAFYDVVNPKLEENGFNITEGAFFASSPICKSKNEYTNIYMHPIKFSGLVTKDEFERLQKILVECGEVVRIVKTEQKPTYNLSPREHARIWSSNISIIDEFIDEYVEKCEKHHQTIIVDDIAFAFAKKYAIETVTKSCVMGSDNFEWMYIENVIHMKIARDEISENLVPYWY